MQINFIKNLKTKVKETNVIPQKNKTKTKIYKKMANILIPN